MLLDLLRFYGLDLVLITPASVFSIEKDVQAVAIMEALRIFIRQNWGA